MEDIDGQPGETTADVSSPNIHVDLELFARQAERALFQTEASPDLDSLLGEDPLTIGRFTLLEPLGEGGMGVVYQAHDAQLSRLVALKVANTRAHYAPSDRRRLRREATALAQLSHPNVVHVYEVGESNGQLFIVMELVEGDDARQWLRDEPRSPAEVLDVFVQAGRGLAAAHAAGIVHRDFKPANIVVGNDGRARVVDFGLATDDHGVVSGTTIPGSSDDSEHGPSDATRSHGSRRRLLSSTVSRSIVGTLPYMSPEQHEGRPADARSDQFSFCVALYEALFGVRPFSGRSSATLRAQKLSGQLTAPKRSAAVPARIRNAVLRGLSPEPGDRFTNMNALLATLLDDTGRRRRRRFFTGAIVAVVVLSSWLARPMGSDERQPCTGAQRLVTEVYAALDGERIHAAFEAAHVPFASTAADRSSKLLRAYTDEWLEEHVDACEATRVHLEQSEAILDLRMECLSTARRRLLAAVEVLGDADAELVARAHHVIDELPDPSQCSDLARLRRSDVVEPSDIEAVELAREHLALAQALDAVGRYDAASDAIEAAEDALGELVVPQLRIELAIVRGLNLDERGESERAHGVQTQALRSAIAFERPDLAFEAARTIAKLESEVLADYSAAAIHIELAEALHRASGAGADGRILFLDARSRLRHATADYEGALADQSEALEMVDADAHPEQAATLLDVMGRTLMVQSRFAEAEDAFRRAMKLRRDHLGLEHPRHAHSHNTIGNVLYLRGELDAAIDEFQRALSLRVETLGAEHRLVGESYNNLGAVFIELGELELAEQHLRRALELREAIYGPDHPTIANTLDNLGVVTQYLERYQDSLASHQRALDIRTRILGPDHPKLGNSHHGLGKTHHAMGRLEDAERELRIAIALLTAGRGADHPDTLTARRSLAEVLTDAGRVEEASEISSEIAPDAPDE